LGLADLGDLDDAWMVDRVDGDRLVVEAADHVVALGELGQQLLDGDPALDDRVVGLIDGTHPAAADQPHDPVVAELAALHRQAPDSLVLHRSL
jgi:hypothetical protein